MLRHLPFFEALAELEEGSQAWQVVSAGLGVLRVVDASLAGGPAWAASNLWSLHAVRSAVEGMPPMPARMVLTGTVELIAAGGAVDVDLLAARLFAYGRSLDLDARYALAADVYETVIGIGDRQEHADVVIDAGMRLGYCLRMLGRFDDAGRAYGAARELAAESGDTVKLLRGRVAEGNLARAAGNLPRAERLLDDVIAEATALGLPEVKAIALHDRATVAHARGEDETAVWLMHLALQDAQSPVARDRLLADIAVMFGLLGVRTAARDALLVLAATAQDQHTRWLATVNLMELASLDGAELVFEQYRRQLDRAALPVDLAATYHLFVGQGYRMFGRIEAARQALARAATLAGEHRLNQLTFQVEQELTELERGARPATRRTEEVPEFLRPAVHAIGELRAMAGVG